MPVLRDIPKPLEVMTLPELLTYRSALAWAIRNGTVPASSLREAHEREQKVFDMIATKRKTAA